MKIQHGPKGISFSLFNGLRLSIQYGVMNYCERQDYSAGAKDSDNPFDIVSRDFEWAVLNEESCISMDNGDSVEGRVPFDLLPLVIDRAQRLKPGAKNVRSIGWQVCDAVEALQPQFRADIVRLLMGS